MQIDRSKSLQQLEDQDWGEPTYDSHLVTEIHRLRRVPLRDFTIEDLRITIGQNISLQYLIPIALEHLHDNPFAEGSCYPCDLLENALRADPKFWQTHPDLKTQLIKITERAIAAFPNLSDIANETVVDEVTTAYQRFTR